jgi:hypothetical protein
VPQFNFHYDRKHLAGQPDVLIRVLCGFRNVDNYRHFQRRSAARALLAGRNPGMLSFQIDLRGYCVSAHWAVRQAVSVILL